MDSDPPEPDYHVHRMGQMGPPSGSLQRAIRHHRNWPAVKPSPRQLTQADSNGPGGLYIAPRQGRVCTRRTGGSAPRESAGCSSADRSRLADPHKLDRVQTNGVDRQRVVAVKAVIVVAYQLRRANIIERNDTYINCSAFSYTTLYTCVCMKCWPPVDRVF